MRTKIRAENRVTGVHKDAGVNEAGDLLSARGDATYTESARTRSFMWRNTTAVAAIDTIPSVATMCAIYNSAPDRGRSIIIDALFATQVGNAGAALEQCVMIFCVSTTRAAVPVDSGIVPIHLNGLGVPTDTVAVTTIGTVDLDAVNGLIINWYPIGRNVRTMVHTLPGLNMWAAVNGRIIVAPGRYLGLHVLASSGDVEFNGGFMWHEKQLTLE